MTKPVNLRKIIKATINREIETKTTITNFSDGTQYAHMSINDLDATPWYTGQGIGNPDGASNNSTAAANRIGDEVLAKGVRYKLFLENNERFPLVHHRFMFVRCSRGQTINNSQVFMGRSDNKLIDDINRSKITVLYDRTFKIRAPNPAVYGENVVQDVTSLVGHGTYHSGDSVHAFSTMPGAQIVTIYVPYHKDNKYHKLKYVDDTSATPKFYDYHLLYMPYVVQNTSTTLNVSKINDMQKVFYFKDP